MQQANIFYSDKIWECFVFEYFTNFVHTLKYPKKMFLPLTVDNDHDVWLPEPAYHLHIYGSETEPKFESRNTDVTVKCSIGKVNKDMLKRKLKIHSGEWLGQSDSSKTMLFLDINTNNTTHSYKKRSIQLIHDSPVIGHVSVKNTMAWSTSFIYYYKESIDILLSWHHLLRLTTLVASTE